MQFTDTLITYLQLSSCSSQTHWSPTSSYLRAVHRHTDHLSPGIFVQFTDTLITYLLPTYQTTHRYSPDDCKFLTTTALNLIAISREFWTDPVSKRVFSHNRKPANYVQPNLSLIWSLSCCLKLCDTDIRELLTPRHYAWHLWRHCSHSSIRHQALKAQGLLYAPPGLRSKILLSAHTVWLYVLYRYVVAQLVEALRYKPEGRGFDSRWYHWNFSLT